MREKTAPIRGLLHKIGRGSIQVDDIGITAKRFFGERRIEQIGVRVHDDRKWFVQAGCPDMRLPLPLDSIKTPTLGTDRFGPGYSAP